MYLFKYFVLLITLNLFFQNLQAQPIWWLGGAGDWDDLNWSLTGPTGANCGCIPNANNTVAIFNLPGVAGTEEVTVPDLVSAHARSVFVDSNTILQIGTNALGDGILTVEDPTSRGLDIYGMVRVRDILNIHDTPAEAVFVRQSGELIVQTSGLLNIIPNDAIIGKGIVNNGLVETRSNMNNGTRGVIKIRSINDTGLENKSTGQLLNNGTLDISLIHITGKGLLNMGGGSVLLNGLGKLLIDQVGGTNINNIQNHGLMTSDGTITITNATGAAAVLNSKNSGFPNAFTNNGSITITDCQHHGIRNTADGIFNNDGVLTIQNIFTNDHQGIWNQATFRNKLKGSITITDVNDPFCRGIHNQNVFENEGTIAIDDVDGGNGFLNESSDASFTNIGKLTISNTVFQGLRNVTNAFILNADSIIISGISNLGVHNNAGSIFNNTGYIEVSGCIGANVYGIYNQDLSIINNGGSGDIFLFDINGAGSNGILNESTFNNNASIRIDSVEQSYGIENRLSGQFHNLSGAIIDIRNINSSGIRLEDNSVFENAGAIDIRHVLTNNFAIFCSSVFENHLNGKVRLLNNYGGGIRVLDGGSYSNSDSLIIDSTMNTGILVDNSSLFMNLAPGVIDMKNVQDGYGIHNKFQFDNSGDIYFRDFGPTAILNETTEYFKNQGDGFIEIRHFGPGANIYAIQNEGGLYVNEACAELKVYRTILVNIGEFTNNGFMTTVGALEASLNGSIINNGVIDFNRTRYYGEFDAVVNNGIIAPIIYGPQVVGVTSTSVLLGQGKGITIGSSYYSDALLTLNVGPISTANFTWIPSLAPVDKVFINMDNGCTNRIIEQKLQLPTYAQCSDISNPELQSVNPGNWESPYTWNYFNVPNACLDLIIHSSDSIFLGQSVIGYGKTLDIQQGAVLEVLGELRIGY